jgi:uncharacterized membrane protein YbhN (UPF0104 family)
MNAPAEGARKRWLLFSVDTEPDDPEWQGLKEGPWSHENLKGLPELQRRLAALDVKSTYLVTHSVAESGVLEKHLGADMASGRCEIGAHFHPGDTPPFPRRFSQDEDGDNVLKVPDGLLEEKFANLDATLTRRFGKASSHRAGAWAMDGRMTSLLERYGYGVDTSVTPGISWKRNGRADFLAAPMKAYRLGPGDPAVPGDGRVLEVPVSIWSHRRWAGTMAGSLFGDLLTMPLNARGSLPARIVRALRPRPPQWLRPAFAWDECLPGMIRDFEAGGCDYLHVMCHSNELWPGASPYSRTRADLDLFYARMESMLGEAISLGYVPVTLSGYAAAHGVSPAPQQVPRPAPPEIGARPAAAPPPPVPEVEGVPKGSRKAALLGKAAVSGIAIAAILYFADWKEVRMLLAPARLELASACLFAILLGIIVNCWKLRAMDPEARMGMGSLFTLHLVRMLFNNILPGGIGGEAYRVLKIGRAIGSMGRAAGLVFWSRISGLWAQVLFSGAGIMAYHHGSPMRIGLGLGFLAAAAALPILGPGLGGRMLAFARPGRFLANQVEVARFNEYWDEVRTRRGRMSALVIWSIVDQAALVLVFMLASASMGNAIDFWKVSPVILLGTLASLIPFTLGGLGIAEAAYAFGFHLMGYSLELGLACSLLIRSLCLFPSLAGALIFALEKRVPAAVAA